MMLTVITTIHLSTIIALGSVALFASGLPCSVSRVSGTEKSRDSVVVDCKSLGLSEVRWNVYFSIEMKLVITVNDCRYICCNTFEHTTLFVRIICWKVA